MTARCETRVNTRQTIGDIKAKEFPPPSEHSLPTMTSASENPQVSKSNKETIGYVVTLPTPTPHKVIKTHGSGAISA